MVSARSADAPEKQILTDVKSTRPACMSGWFRSAMYSVGTPLRKAGFVRVIVFIKSPRSRGFGTSASGWPPTNPSPCVPTFA